MAEPSLSSPVWRIAAVTGEEPADIEASVAALLADGYTFDEVWAILGDAINTREPVRDVAARHLARP